jgi:putative FmdB family regulatory protein
MPTYVYECKSCNTVFEADQSIKDDPLDTCIACSMVGTVKRVIQPVGISFKGSGFYVNDSRTVASKPAGDGVKPEDAPIPEPATPTPVADKSTEAAPASPTPPSTPSKESSGG